MWWDISDPRLAPKTAEVRIIITLAILVQMGQVRNLLAFMQQVIVDGLVV